MEGTQNGWHIEAGVATFALFRLQGRPEQIDDSSVRRLVDVCRANSGEIVVGEGTEWLVRFSLPSYAVRAAVRLADEDGSVAAAVLTREFDSVATSRLREDLIRLLEVAELGQVVVTLAVHELSRTALEGTYLFLPVGNYALTPLNTGEGNQDGCGTERLFFAVSSSWRERLSPGRIANEPRELGDVARVPWRENAFIGRTRELAELQRLLDLSRLVTLVGPSGIGKSALAHRFALSFDEGFSSGDEGLFPGGVIYLDLSPVAHEGLVGPTLVRLLGASKLPGEGNREAIAAFLQSKRCVIVLDNVEHVLEEVRGFVSQILRDCPDVGILLASQRPTGLKGEMRFKVGGLDVPDPSDPVPVIRESDAVALFADRAQSVDPSFRIRDENAAAVAMICRRLDGIPLAIELAAAKTAVLTPRQILDRLDDRFLLLKDGSSDRPDRHRTLRATIDWGFDQLTQEAKALLRRLSLFEGAFTLEEAGEVCGFSSHSELLAPFEELWDSSLLCLTSVGTPEKRFHLSETVRLYAEERLKEAGELAETASRHDAWCLAMSEQASIELDRERQAEWLDRLDAVYDDMRVCVERTFSSRESAEPGIAIVLNLHRFFLLRNYISEGLRVVEGLARGSAVSNARRYPQLLNFGSALAFRLGDRPRSHRYALTALRLSRRQGDEAVSASARGNLAVLASELGLNRRAARHFRAAAEIFRSLGDERRLLSTLVNLIGVAPDLEEDATSALAAEIERILERRPDPSLRAYLHQNLANLAMRRGEVGLATRHGSMSLSEFQRTQDYAAMSTCLRVLAHCMELDRQPQRAARLLGAAREAHRSTEVPIRAEEARELDSMEERLIRHLGPDRVREYALEGAIATPHALRHLLL